MTKGNIKTPMSPDEFAIEMQKIKEIIGYDDEMAHIEMDDLMCMVLCELGYSKGINIYNSQDKYYI